MQNEIMDNIILDDLLLDDLLLDDLLLDDLLLDDEIGENILAIMYLVHSAFTFACLLEIIHYL